MGIESELCREKGKSNWDIGPNSGESNGKNANPKP